MTRISAPIKQAIDELHFQEQLLHDLSMLCNILTTAFFEHKEDLLGLLEEEDQARLKEILRKYP